MASRLLNQLNLLKTDLSGNKLSVTDLRTDLSSNKLSVLDASAHLYRIAQFDSSNNATISNIKSVINTREIYNDRYTFPNGIGPYQIDAIPVLLKDKFKMPKFSSNAIGLQYKDNNFYDTPAAAETVVYVPSKRTTIQTTNLFSQTAVNTNDNIGHFQISLEDWAILRNGKTNQSGWLGTSLSTKVQSFVTAANNPATTDASRNALLNAIVTDSDYATIKNNVKLPFKVWNQVKDASGGFQFTDLLDLSGVAIKNQLVDNSYYTTQCINSSWPLDSSGNPTEILPVAQNVNAINSKMGLFIYFLGNGQLQADPTSILPSLIASLGYVVLVCAGNPINGDGLVTKSSTTISKLIADKVIDLSLNSFTNDYYISPNTCYGAPDNTGVFNRINFRNSGMSVEAQPIFERYIYQQLCILNKLGLYNLIDWNNVMAGGMSGGGYALNIVHDMLNNSGKTRYFTLNNLDGSSKNIKPDLIKVKALLGYQTVHYEVSRLSEDQKIPAAYTDDIGRNNAYNIGINVLKCPMVYINGDGDAYSRTLNYENLFASNAQTIFQLTKKQADAATEIIFSQCAVIYKPANGHLTSVATTNDYTEVYVGSLWLNWLNGGLLLPKNVTLPELNNTAATGLQNNVVYMQYDDYKSLIIVQLIAHRFLGNNYPLPTSVYSTVGWRVDLMPTHCDITTDHQYMKVGPRTLLGYDSSYNLTLTTGTTNTGGNLIGNTVALSVDASKNLLTDATSIQLSNRKLYEDKWTFPYGLGPYQVDAIPLVIKDKFQLPMFSLNQTTDVSGGADVSSNGYQTNTLFDVPACPEVLVLVPSKRTTTEFTNVFRKPSANTCYGPGSFALALEDYGITYGTEERLGTSIVLDASGKRFWERINDFKTACLSTSPSSISSRQTLLSYVLSHPDYSTLSTKVKYPIKVWDASNNGSDWYFDNLNQLVTDISDNGVPIPLQNDVSGGKYNTTVSRSSWETYLDASGNSTLLNTTNANAQSGKLGLLVFFAGSGGAPFASDSWYFMSLCASLGYVVVCTTSNPIASTHCKLNSTSTLTSLLTDSSSTPTLTAYDRSVSTSPYYISHVGLYGSGRSDYLAGSQFYKGSYNIGNQFCYPRSPEVGKINERFLYQIKCILGKLGIHNSINYSNVMIGGLSAGGNGITTAHRLISENITANIGKTLQFTLNDTAGNSTGTKPYVLTPKALLNWQSVLFDYTQSGKNMEVNRRLLDMNNINSCSITELKVPMITITGDTDLWVPNPFRNTWYNLRYQTIYQNTRKQVIKEPVANNAPSLGTASALGNILQLSMVLYKSASNHSANESPYDPSTTTDGITSGTFMSGIGKEMVRGWELNQYVSFPATESVYASGIKSELGYLQFEDIKVASAIQLVVHRFLGKEYPVPAAAFGSLGMKFDLDPTNLEVSPENQYQRIGPVSEISYDASYNLTINTPAIKLTNRTVDSTSIIQEGQSALLSVDASGNLATTANALKIGNFMLGVDASGVFTSGDNGVTKIYYTPIV